MTRAVAWAIVALVVAAILGGIGTVAFLAGRTKERAAWHAIEQRRAETAARELAAEIKRGQDASGALSTSLRVMHDRYSTLEEKFHDLRSRVPLVIPAAGRAVAARGPTPAAPGGTSTAAGAAAPDRDAQPVGERDHGLSGAAVWMWNSALAGVDVPVLTAGGACGAADTSTGACAADSGFTVDDAWANHEANARSCAIDRQRHRALIQFIQQKAAE